MARDRTGLWVVVGTLSAAVVLILLVAGGAGLYHLARRMTPTDSDSDSHSDSDSDSNSDSDSDSDSDSASGSASVSGSASASHVPPIDPTEAMRARYRPGPYVSLDALVPGPNTSRPSPGRLWQPGHTLDTPWLVAGSELRAGPLPSASRAGAPAIRHGSGEDPSRPLTVLPRVPAQVHVRADSGGGPDGEVAGLAVTFDGYPGWFWIPASVQTELGRVAVAGQETGSVVFAANAPVPPPGHVTAPGQPFAATMRVAAVDVAGRISPFIERKLQVMPVGQGDVEVALTMSEPTDLDLYVVDPTGVVVYYGNTSAASGGRLDLDANAACSGNMGVDNEHVYWPTGGAPAGVYTVRVANFESCIENRPVSYRITVRACGETAVLSGRFDGQADTRQCTSSPGTERGWCQDVVSFVLEACASTRSPS